MLTDLSLIRYPGFATLQETQALRAELTETYPRHLEEGVHLIVVQDADGSLVVATVTPMEMMFTPFRREEVDQLILDAFQDLLPGCRPGSPSDGCVLTLPLQGPVGSSSQSGSVCTLCKSPAVQGCLCIWPC